MATLESHSSDDTRRLVTAARSGDGNAFRALVAPHEVRIILFLRHAARGVLAGDADERDLLQDTLVAAWCLMPQYEHRSDDYLHRWLVAIARHVVKRRCSYLRAKGRRRARPSGSDLDDSAIHPSSPTLSPSRHAVRGEQAERLSAALATLPSDQRAIVRANRLEGTPIAEIARRMNLRRSTVFDRLQEGIVRLEQLLRRGSGESSQ